jgi:GAF domain-containing protein
MCPQESDAVPTVLIGEGRLLEMISIDVPLSEVLNRICAALDVQVGNVVSVILTSEDDEHSLHELAEQAVQLGLYVFSCCAILSKDEQLLGTLETYSCLTRRPAVSQTKLIQRASQLAALAIERHDREEEPWSLALSWKSAGERRLSEGTLHEN